MKQQLQACAKLRLASGTPRGSPDRDVGSVGYATPRRHPEARRALAKALLAEPPGAWAPAVTADQYVDSEQSRERARKVQDEFGHVLNMIGAKARTKWSNPRELFRFAGGGGKDGLISREEMRHFFRCFNMPWQTADAFFEAIDEDGSGDVSHMEFMRHVGPHVYQLAPGKQQQGWEALPLPKPAPAPPILAENPVQGPGLPNQIRVKGKLRDAMEDVEHKLETHFKNNLHAFRFVDLSGDGNISRAELRTFFERFGWQAQVSDELFDMIDVHKTGEVDYATFHALWSHVLGRGNTAAPRSVEIEVPEDRDLQREINEIAKAARAFVNVRFKSMRDAFRTLGVGDGSPLTKEDVHKLLSLLHFRPEDAEKVIKVIDTDGNGTVDYNEFAAFLTPGPADLFYG